MLLIFLLHLPKPYFLDAFKFLDFSFLDILDIALVAILLYYVYKLIRGTAAINIFLGIAIVYLIWKLTVALKMELLSDILGKFLGGGFIALIIVFQQEIRKFLLMVGSTNFTTKKGFLKRFKLLSNMRKNDDFISTDVDSIIDACEEMASTKTGALIIIQRNNNLDLVKQTGDKMNAEINKALFTSIFYKNSPLHDGALIIEDNFITATRVILPVEKDIIIPARFGLRHRAALGITMRSDALALAVSEETGQISYIKDGEFILYKDINHLKDLIKEDLD
ncbi:diadenylate cyclase [Aureibaculum sp. A20]|uniref:Diadenylate cyclase n=1 Tax=Aureibaculum flavum TaxID=2795986 RepID=A0ABS0WSQ2_9FLAO|nr:diadenylate cyclase [Aureibaculum flavum]